MIALSLLFPDKDPKPIKIHLPPHANILAQDLGLDVLLKAMALGDDFLYQVAQHTLMSLQTDISTIIFRQDVLQDCINNPGIIKELYQISMKFLEQKRKGWLWISHTHASPSFILSDGRRLLDVSLALLWELREISQKNINNFTSQGLKRFFSTILRELSHEYLNEFKYHIKKLSFPQGVLVSAQLGKGNEGINYTLLKPREESRGWFKHILFSKTPTYTYKLHPRDEAGARILSELRNQGLTRAANIVAQAAEYLDNFFNTLRWELGFYIGCLNLYEQLKKIDACISFPRPLPKDEFTFSCKGLYDISLALIKNKRVIGNNISPHNSSLIIITGPNQGGKTTFLRSVGLAHLMMQSGMFVPAVSFCSNLVTGVFTHFKQQEDRDMEMGKFKEELQRMSTIVDQISQNGLILFNESFASTNEREGSEVSIQIIRALLQKKIKVFYVTHMYELAHYFYKTRDYNPLFLRAQRLPNGERTYRLIQGEPLRTSYGIDIFRKIFKRKLLNDLVCN